MFCAADSSGKVWCLQSNSCKGYSSYLCIISWAGRERGFCALWRRSSRFFYVSLQCDTPLFTFFCLSVLTLLALFFQALKSLALVLLVDGSFRFNVILVLVQKPGCLTASPLCIRPWQVSPALMHLLKAWLFIHFLFTIFGYMPGLGNYQPGYFFTLPCSLCCLISALETHGVGFQGWILYQCFWPIYLNKLFFLIIFLLFWIKTEDSRPFLFALQTHQNTAKHFHLQTKIWQINQTFSSLLWACL